MNVTRITPDYSVASQITAADVIEIAALGFRSIMCNRPDAEDPGQPDFAEIDAAARTQGLVTTHVPVVSGVIYADDVEVFRAAMAELPRPVLAYCRSGTRCQNLWRLTL